MIVRRLKVEGSTVSEVGYDVATRTLEIVFTTTPQDLYVYQNVSADLFAMLVNAHSIGTFLHKRFRSSPREFPFTKVTASRARSTSSDEPATLYELALQFETANSAARARAASSYRTPWSGPVNRATSSRISAASVGGTRSATLSARATDGLSSRSRCASCSAVLDREEPA